MITARLATSASCDERPIGGFFERHEPDDDAAGPDLVQAWTEGRPHAAFVNARSAFAALAAAHPQATVWLPAYLCGDLIQPAYADRVRFYPVTEGFSPELTPLQAAKAGDMVLLAAYFGLPVAPAARAFAPGRPDLCFVEDRAQALDPGPGVAGAWRLYSPRKLLGVADGGLLIAPSEDAVLPKPSGKPDATALWLAAVLRHADPAGRDNAQWHAANQAKEAAMAATDEAITPRSLSILKRTSLRSLAAPRLRNWQALNRRLRAWSALPADPSSPPLGYVLRLDSNRRDGLLRALHARRIFAAVHWPAIAAPGSDFPREAAWTRELITLPCDHRYGAAEMARIAAVVEDVLG